MAAEQSGAGRGCARRRWGRRSLAVVATVALEAGLPFVCVPAGTRNHFALDLGVDRHDLGRRARRVHRCGRALDRCRRGERPPVPQQPLARDLRRRRAATRIPRRKASNDPRDRARGSRPELWRAGAARGGRPRPRAPRPSRRPGFQQPLRARAAGRDGHSSNGGERATRGASSSIRRARPAAPRDGPGPRQLCRSTLPARWARASTARRSSWSRRCGWRSDPMHCGSGSAHTIPGCRLPAGSRHQRCRDGRARSRTSDAGEEPPRRPRR